MYEEIRTALEALQDQSLSEMDKVFCGAMLDKGGDRWSSGDIVAAKNLLGMWRGAMASKGINVDALEYPEWINYDKTQTDGSRNLLLAREPDRNGVFWVTVEFIYSAHLEDLVRLIPGRKHDQENNIWRVPFNTLTAEKLASLVISHGFNAYTKLHEMIIETIKDAGVSKEMSRAEDAQVSVLNLGRVLRPFQKGGVHYAVKHERTFIADEMGLGKTYQGLATIEAVEAYPAIVVAPAQLTINWLKESLILLPEFRRIGLLKSKKIYSAHLINGEHVHLEKANDLDEFDLIVTNYDIIKPTIDTWLCTSDAVDIKSKTYNEGDLLPLDKKSKAYAALYHIMEDNFIKADSKISKNGIIERLKALEPKTVLLDESHYCKNGKSDRTKGMIELAKYPSVKYKLALTGTPILNRPIEIAKQLEIIGRIEEFGGWFRFAQRYCNPQDDGFGHINYNGGSNLEELNERLRATCYIRRTKAQVLPELPAKVHSNISIELTNRKEYEKAKASVVLWLRDRDYANRAFMNEIAHHSTTDQENLIRERNAESAEAAARAEELVKLSHLKMLSARGKVDPVITWINDFLQSDQKLIVFAYHKDIQQDILAKFPGAAKILAKSDYEGNGDIRRQENVDRFQSDPECRIVICGIKSGGVGITLTAASNVLFIEQGWNPADMDQAEDRAHRMGQKGSVNVWNMIGEDTIDVDFAELINSKRETIDAATEGGSDGTSESISSQLISRMLSEA